MRKIIIMMFVCLVFSSCAQMTETGKSDLAKELEKKHLFILK